MTLNVVHVESYLAYVRRIYNLMFPATLGFRQLCLSLLELVFPAFCCDGHAEDAAPSEMS